MKGNIYKLFSMILLVIVVILLVLLTYHHFAHPGKPVWKDWDVGDSSHVDTTRVHSNK